MAGGARRCVWSLVRDFRQGQTWHFLLPVRCSGEAPRNPGVPGTQAQAACLPDRGRGASSPTWRTSCPQRSPFPQWPQVVAGSPSHFFFFFQINLPTTQRLAALFLWGTQLTPLPRGPCSDVGLANMPELSFCGRSSGYDLQVLHPFAMWMQTDPKPRSPLWRAAAPGPRVSPWRPAATLRREMTSHRTELLLVRECWCEQQV